MKTCTKCGETKPANEFYKDARKRGGLRSNCKACSNAATAKYSADNPEKTKAYDAKYYAKNTEKCKAGKAKYNAENPDKVKASQAESRAIPANRAKAKSRSAKYRADNPDKVRYGKAEWVVDNPEACRIARHNRRARKREAGGMLSKGLADKLFTLQRGMCPCCGKPLGDNYHLDHRMPTALGGLNIDNNIQLMRATCNMQKNAKHPIEFMQQRGFLL